MRSKVPAKQLVVGTAVVAFAAFLFGRLIAARKVDEEPFYLGLA